ncbi:hypothetical protein AB0F18_25920 [Streptomyces sp. NPDC029216]|uniref:hypothetical protein n=1 Tax=Streptomyces sp. NPDC029216 TaxID=3154701 RepID=UPI0033EAF0FE
MRKSLALAAGAAVTGLVALVATATAPTVYAAPHTSYCATLLSPAAVGRGEQEPILACSDTSRSEAVTAALHGKRHTLLLEQYRDSGYGGEILDSFYGYEGGCDSTPYRLVNYEDIATNVSSMKGYNHCNIALLTSIWGNQETITLPASSLGSDLNDAVHEILVFSETARHVAGRESAAAPRLPGAEVSSWQLLSDLTRR